jgi:hypothetical protein
MRMLKSKNALNSREQSEIDASLEAFDSTKKDLKVNSDNLIRMNNQVNKILKEEEKRPSIVEEFANPNTEMPLYMDPDDG